MDDRQNVLSLFRRMGYERVPVSFGMCPALFDQFRQHTGSDDPREYFKMPWRFVNEPAATPVDPKLYLKYYTFGLKPDTVVDGYGVAHEPGSEAARHMTYMRHPLKTATEIEQIHMYPLPDYDHAQTAHMRGEADALHSRGLAAAGGMECTVWETAWYIRGMEELMADMLTDEAMAAALLDRITAIAKAKACAFAAAGVDILFLGDDIGMQRTPMMSTHMYAEWLKPRLKLVIDAARASKPDILVVYHSCGYIVPFIPHLIEAGIDVLNPVQPECMDFGAIHGEYGGALSFYGTIGTQTTMPFGTAEDVRRTVFRNMDIAGALGGLMAAPTHLLEPEVPLANVLAYVRACEEYVK